MPLNGRTSRTSWTLTMLAMTLVRFAPLTLLACLPDEPNFLQAQVPASAASLAITHVTVIDTAAGSARGDMTVVIDGIRIITVGKSRTVKAPRAASVIDGRGKFLIPGLWDMHVHMFNNGDNAERTAASTFFPLLVANGVVGVRDMWTDPEDIQVARRWNTELAAGKLVGPQVMVSSRLVDGEPPGWPTALVVRNAEEAREAVRALKAAGAGFIKVVWNLSRDAYFAIADESQKQGIPFEGHVPFAVTAAEVSDAGQRTIEHMTGIGEACQNNRPGCRMTPPGARRWPIDSGATARGWCRPACCSGDQLELIRTRDAGTPCRRGQAELTGKPRRSIRPRLQPSGEPCDKQADSSPARISRFHADGSCLASACTTSWHSSLTTAIRLWRRFKRQRSTQHSIAGRSTIREPWSRGSAQISVLLDADPLADIRNTSRINAVILNGRLLDRTKLDQLLAEGEAAASKQKLPPPKPAPMVGLVVTAAENTATAFAGTWATDFQGQASVDLTANGTKLTGTIKGTAATAQIFDGRIDGNTMTFKVKSPDGDRTITFTGTVTGNEIDFTRDVEVVAGGGPGGLGLFGALGPRRFSASRVK